MSTAGVAEEATRLFAAIGDWARTRGGDVLAGEGQFANGSATCGLCPLCQAIALARSVRPESVEHLVNSAAGLVAAVRTTVVADTRAPVARPPVQRIEVLPDTGATDTAASGTAAPAPC